MRLQNENLTDTSMRIFQRLLKVQCCLGECTNGCSVVIVQQQSGSFRWNVTFVSQGRWLSLLSIQGAVCNVLRVEFRVAEQQLCCLLSAVQSCTEENTVLFITQLCSKWLFNCRTFKTIPPLQSALKVNNYKLLH